MKELLKLIIICAIIYFILSELKRKKDLETAAQKKARSANTNIYVEPEPGPEPEPEPEPEQGDPATIEVFENTFTYSNGDISANQYLD